ncbi:MAG: glycosyltransferase family 2 protein, partial [Kiritimatiellae bacterium]|nr:glycosyltransferase family 2 protein [Kiritimatiellia bacterium]
MPKVSIIIPVCNVEKYLRQCLDSVVNQTLRDIEIVCVDDGSTDSSPAILAEYAAKDPRVKVVSLPNSGTVVARKRAIAAATGEWCFFLDPDDWIEPETCERMLSSAAASGADIVQCGFAIEETAPRTAALRAKSETYFNRPAGVYAGETLLAKVYAEKKLAWNLIGRMARAAICKPAFAEQVDAYSINETDVYATFHLMPRVRSLEVVTDRFYHYRYGVGISTTPRLQLGSFVRTMGKLDT